MPDIVRKLFRVGHNRGGWFVYPYTNPPHDKSLVKGDEVLWRRAVRCCCEMNRAADSWLRTNELTIARYTLIWELENLVRRQRAEMDKLEGHAGVLNDEIASLTNIVRIQSDLIAALEGRSDG